MKNNYFIICQIIYILIVLNCFHFFKDFFYKYLYEYNKE